MSLPLFDWDALYRKFRDLGFRNGLDLISAVQPGPRRDLDVVQPGLRRDLKSDITEDAEADNDD